VLVLSSSTCKVCDSLILGNIKSTKCGVEVARESHTVHEVGSKVVAPGKAMHLLGFEVVTASSMA
jgi:hypothetical protein